MEEACELVRQIINKKSFLQSLKELETQATDNSKQSEH